MKLRNHEDLKAYAEQLRDFDNELRLEQITENAFRALQNQSLLENAAEAEFKRHLTKYFDNHTLDETIEHFTSVLSDFSHQLNNSTSAAQNLMNQLYAREVGQFLNYMRRGAL